MRIVDKIKAPLVELSGFEPEMTEEERSIQQTMNRFAREVMRPLAEKMDKMDAEEAIGKDSPIWTFFEEFSKLGFTAESILEMEPETRARLIPIVFEELGWGDAGFALGCMVSVFPEMVARFTGKQELIERFSGKLGCWLATQPDRGGSDAADFEGRIIHEGSQQSKGNLRARFEGDEIVINGQSAAWVSHGPIAQSALAYLHIDYGSGLHKSNGVVNHIMALVPLDIPGVSKGKPLDKMGQRTLPQGEIYFDDVRIPKSYMIAGEDTQEQFLFSVLTEANSHMGLVLTGVARAAFDHALAYSHERKQGGVPIIQHQMTKHRLFQMYSKVEMARGIARKGLICKELGKELHVLPSLVGKVNATQLAFEVANEAMQLFGGNGISREYPMDKLLRDARIALIEDGENYVLGMLGGSYLSDMFTGEVNKY